MQLVLPATPKKKDEEKGATPSSRYDARISIAKTVYCDVTKMTHETTKTLLQLAMKASGQKGI